MKKQVFIICVLLLAVASKAQKSEFPVLTGLYLGQTPPVNEPIIFAPGIVSNGRNHSSVAINPDGNELYWSGAERRIWFTKLENERWTVPDVVSFCKTDSSKYDNPFITPDGKKMFFTSFRPGGVRRTRRQYGIPKDLNRDGWIQNL